MTRTNDKLATQINLDPKGKAKKAMMKRVTDQKGYLCCARMLFDVLISFISQNLYLHVRIAGYTCPRCSGGFARDDAAATEDDSRNTFRRHLDDTFGRG